MNKLFELLRTNKHIKLNHNLLMEIIHQDMLLSDLPSLQRLQDYCLTDEANLATMLNSIEMHIMQKHPLIAHFLNVSVKQDLIRVEKHTEWLEKVIHHTFILDSLVKVMSDDVDFMEEIIHYLLDKRRHFNFLTEKDIFNKLNNGFGAAKTMYVDKGMKDFLTIRKRGYFTEDEIKACQQGIRLNIIEAAITEKNNGFVYNSSVGYALAKKTFTASTVSSEHRVIQLEFHADWVALYQSWNFAFITGNLEHPHILFPKLLIPQIIGAQPNEYIFKRTLALWLSINFYIFAEIKNENKIRLSNSQELAQVWGKINYQYINTDIEQINK